MTIAEIKASPDLLPFNKKDLYGNPVEMSLTMNQIDVLSQGMKLLEILGKYYGDDTELEEAVGNLEAELL